jgi:hypothetical protein
MSNLEKHPPPFVFMLKGRDFNSSLINATAPLKGIELRHVNVRAGQAR